MSAVPDRSAVLLAIVLAGALAAAPARSSLRIARLEAPIEIDGDLADAAWAGATRLEEWYETNPGDNLPAPVENLALLAYDDTSLYAAFRFADPDPERIRAPLADRDNVPSHTDYGGLILDTRNGATTAQMFLANPRGIQYDAISSDVSGEDSSPDFFWDAAARITPGGWELELRIPFSSLRYEGGGEQTWRVMAYRNWPRDFRYQMFSTRLPRDVSCFVCNTVPLEGLEGLPDGGSLVVAPYLAGSIAEEPEDGVVGNRLVGQDPDGDPGVDVKWLPGPRTVLDATINPDFSQIESDAPQIAANERFALFFPEKRPFFLESIDLFSTPIQAVYTRSFTAPRWGARATGEVGDGGAYTVLVGEDRGGGSTIVPGPDGSSLAEQDFGATVLLGRWRRRVGRSFWSVVATARELDGGGHNRVAGPDFQWRPNDQDTVTGQLLWSDSETPHRPDLADEWDGRGLGGHAALLSWSHHTSTWDWWVEGRDVHEEFRADSGFVPRVGYRATEGTIGRTFRPQDRFLHRIRASVYGSVVEDRDGDLLSREWYPAVGMSGGLDSFFRLQWTVDSQRVDGRLLDRERLFWWAEASPGRRLGRIALFGTLGDEIDFANGRTGTGGSFEATLVSQATDRLELRLEGRRRWIDVDAGGRRDARLLTATVARLRATWNFSARSWLRLIADSIETERDPTLYADDVDSRREHLGLSAVFAWKLDWQTVVFAGVGSERSLSEEGILEDAGRRAFVKVSYAFQR